MRDRILAKARELIAARLMQAQVRRGNGVVIRESPERSTIEISPETGGGEPTVERRTYRAGEIVVSESGVRVAPFLIKVYDPCDEVTEGYPTDTFSSAFPFIVPKIGAVSLDAVTPPVLSTNDSGVAYLKCKFTWGAWTGPEFTFTPYFYYYLVSAEIVTLPIGADPTTGGPYDQRMAEVASTITIDGDDYEYRTFDLQYADTYSLTLLGWWEEGGGVQQALLRSGTNVSFGDPFNSGNTTPEDTRVILPDQPTAYINPIP